MSKPIYSVITGTGSYIPTGKIQNKDFLNNEFFDSQGNPFSKTNEEIVQQLEDITGIKERIYVSDELVVSDIGFFAAKDALESSGTDKETLDYIIVAHNFGDVRADNRRTDMLPTIASKIKHKLRIENPCTVAYDIPFGCPGWIQGMIQADYYIKSGDAKRALVIGAEIMSRVIDPHDMDCMIFSDGAGATIVEARNSEKPVGIVSHKTRTDTLEEAYYLQLGPSYNPDFNGKRLFAKMQGRKVYEYALSHVPQIIKDSIDKAGLGITDIGKALIHQANAKMDEAILLRLLKLYGKNKVPEDLMPMTIDKFGNNSVATIPIMVDLMLKGKMNNWRLNSKDNAIFASVGAGMNINAMVYRMP